MLSDSENYEDSDAEEDLSNRSLEVAKSPNQDDLLPLLECPVCMDLALPPIRTCTGGHIICCKCCPKLLVCPLCLQNIGMGRNFFAEDFLNKSVIKCKYYEDGCREQLPGSRILKHVDSCFYRPVKCRQCNKKVAFADIEDHLYKQHKISQWDLNDGGSRILLCQKFRTSNPPPFGIMDNVDSPSSQGFSRIALLATGLIALLLVLDFYSFELEADADQDIIQSYVNSIVSTIIPF